MQGLFVAIFTLCLISLLSCTPVNYSTSKTLLQDLQDNAAAGEIDSQYRLGLQYTVKGESEADFTRGYNWFLSAANQGHVEAQYMAGMGKLLGRGTVVDRKGAVEFFSMAAEKGHARAQYQVGNAYLNGAGVKKDQVWGRYWLEQAAWSGHEFAQFLLAALFSRGVGGQKDNAEAWRWAMKASGKGLERAAHAVLNLEKKMSSEELAKGMGLLKSESVMDEKLYRIPRIRYIQTALNRLGFNAGPEDGIEGSQTRSAILNYLQLNGFDNDISVSGLIKTLRSKD